MFQLKFRFLMVFVLTTLLIPHAYAAPSQPITYQGRLTNAAGNAVVDGTYKIQFSIYDDPTAGSILWSEKLEVTTVNGLFTVLLGEDNLFDPVLFSESPVYLGLQVDSDPELTPRKRIASVPRALNSLRANSALTAVSAALAPAYLPLAGGNITGITDFQDSSSSWKQGGQDRIKMLPLDSRVSTYGGDNKEQVRIWGQDYGQVLLFDGQPQNVNTASLSANFNSGGSLTLTNFAGNAAISLNAGAASDGSVQLPDGAVNSHEMLDEPGIAESVGSTITNVTLATTDILTVTITTPASGYVVLDGKGYAVVTGTTGGNSGGVQIDETAGGSTLVPYAQIYGFVFVTPTTSPISFPFNVTRTYFKIAGTYTFRMECQVNSLGSGGTQTINEPMLRATFYPTSYGTVNTLVSSGGAGEFDRSEAVVAQSEVDSKKTGTIMYKVDLRELELKAAKLRAEAEKAERELAEARLKEASTRQTLPATRRK